MTTVAITGAAGKTGRAVTRHFLDQGYEVRPIDRPACRADTAVMPASSVSVSIAPT